MEQCPQEDIPQVCKRCGAQTSAFSRRTNLTRDACADWTRDKEQSAQHSLRACQTGAARSARHTTRLGPNGAAARDASCQHQQALPYASLERQQVALRIPLGSHRQARGGREASWPSQSWVMR